MNAPDTAPRPVFLARVYDDPLPVGGRYLVERLWPGGVRRDALQLSGWLRDLAPSTELRRWFDHRPERWEEFQRRYRGQLATSRDALITLREALSHGPVVLVYTARDRDRNSAVVLAAYLQEWAE